MTVYYSLFLIVLLTGLLLRPKAVQNETVGAENTFVQPKRATVYLIFSFLLIGLVIGLRHITVGADTANYVREYFVNVRERGIIGDNPEIVLRLISWFCQLFSPEYQVFLAAAGFLTAFLFAKWIYDNSRNVFISTIIFLGMFFVQSLNLVREWLAIAFIVNADTAFRRKKYVPFLILFLLAVFSHMTAIAYLAVFLIGLIKKKKLAFFLTVIGCVVFFLLRNQIFDLIVTLFPKYYSYVNNSLYINEAGFNAKDVIFLVILAAFLFALGLRKECFDEEEYNQFYTYSVLLVLSLTFSLCGQSFFMLHRVVFYYSIFLMVSIPNFVSKIKGGWIIYLALIPAMFFMLYRNSYNDNNVVSQYYWFWQKIVQQGG